MDGNRGKTLAVCSKGIPPNPFVKSLQDLHTQGSATMKNTNTAIEEQIENEITALTSNKFKRPSMKINEFMDEYSTLLSQATKDKNKLVAAKFDWTLMPKFELYLDHLLVAVGEAINARLATPEIKKEYDVKLEELQFTIQVLKEVGKHIISNPKNADVKSNFRKIVENSGKSRAATTAIDLIAFISEYPTEAAQTSPAGICVDERYLSEVKDLALTLIKINGSAMMGSRAISDIYSRQKRLLTLSINAAREIRRFAKIAFIDNKQYYKDCYESKVRRRNNRKYRKRAPTV